MGKCFSVQWQSVDVQTTTQNTALKQNLNDNNNRALFVSIYQLHKTWKSIPSNVLNNAIFLFGFKKALLFPTSYKELKEAEASFLGHMRFEKDFLNMILDKDNQGLILWMCPGTPWTIISEKLSSIHKLNDPCKYYHPLLLNTKWWSLNYNSEISCFNISKNEVINQLKNTKSIKFLPVMELFYHSNPDLIPLIRYSDLQKFINQNNIINDTTNNITKQENLYKLHNHYGPVVHNMEELSYSETASESMSHFVGPSFHPPSLLIVPTLSYSNTLFLK